MENLNFDNRIHVKNGLYCLNDIADKLIESTNIREYMKKIQNKEWIDGKYYITKDHMMEILIKLLAIKSDANKILGCSIKSTILL
jgi:hypothetical protein